MDAQLERKEEHEYFPNLDGLRGIAALAVFFFHAVDIFENWIANSNIGYAILSFNGQGGKYGVKFFFLLSGYLISYLLFKERDKRKIKIPQFYARRFLRIWPLYFLVCFLGFSLDPWIQELFSNETSNNSLFFYISFLSNFDIIYNQANPNYILGVLWSIAIEEQFYLAWPFLFLIRKKKTILFSIISLFVISNLYLFNSRDMGWSFGYFHTITNIRYLSMGSLIAFMSYYHFELISKYIQSGSKLTTLSIYLFSLIIMFYKPEISQKVPYSSLLIDLWVILFFAFIILDQNYSQNSFYKIGKSKPLNFLGKISYGIYLLHMVAIALTYWLFTISQKLSSPMLAIFMSLIITILLSAISYKYFEFNFIKLKRFVR